MTFYDRPHSITRIDSRVYSISPIYVANPSNWIWPSSYGSNIGTFDGAKVYRWLDCNELNGFPGAYSVEPFCHINGIGLFCHEFSHCMGLPDLYPQDQSVLDNQEMEIWDFLLRSCCFSCSCFLFCHNFIKTIIKLSYLNVNLLFLRCKISKFI